MPIGLQDAGGMRAQYADADALLFPSLDESFGLPLVEAMTLGLPILAAERPYARSLCGDAAVYFHPSTAASLNAAIGELRRRLSTVWTPAYADRPALLTHHWAEGSRRILAPIVRRARRESGGKKI